MKLLLAVDFSVFVVVVEKSGNPSFEQREGAPCLFEFFQQKLLLSTHVLQNRVQVELDERCELLLEFLAHEIIILVLKDHRKDQLIALLVLRLREGVFRRYFLSSVDFHDHVLQLPHVSHEVLPNVVCHFFARGNLFI